MLRNIHIKLYIINFKFWKKFRHLKEYINTCEYELKYINKSYIDEVCIHAPKYLYLSVSLSDWIPAASEGPRKAYVDPLCAGEKGSTSGQLQSLGHGLRRACPLCVCEESPLPEGTLGVSWVQAGPPPPLATPSTTDRVPWTWPSVRKN